MYVYYFHRQKPLGSYIVDLFCHELMLAIEIDGYSHDLIEVFNKDIKIEKALNEFGVNILRYSDYLVLKGTCNVLN